MDINQLMNSLKETYGFSKTEWNELNGEPLPNFPCGLQRSTFPALSKKLAV